ncbi:flagellar hook capping FlgD N-terminal domain-containing protein [Chromobacterium haemolyticum]|uniref:flagellar hook capping FlgD N-terminal domain-containing protein n=1 Tax=Chromobacterium haemolyticum TaxID=394935 RepID=UPI0009D933A8|nr:flagellar hook capping FlgD N-terminal domain-containing protein [Chromobacterium haemolyticum]OQS33865.1 hypothetical protein B0T39_20295 [Chromobacterium haemolyticum]
MSQVPQIGSYASADKPEDKATQDKPPANNNGGGGLGDTFMKLLLAQIQNQSPLDPMDSSQMVSQMAQLTQLELTEGLVNVSNVNLSLTMESLFSSLSGHVGRTVMVETDSIEVAADKIKGRFELKDSSDKIELVLVDEQGKEYKIAPTVSQGKGQIDFEIDPKQHKLPEGKYKIKVSTSTKETPSVQIAGVLESIERHPDKGILAKVKGVGSVNVSKVMKFLQNEQTTKSNFRRVVA